ncbi:M16 family metallopeptidase [Ornithinimicrobium cerasi]|uniref:M16 family metallopeptidase n=1 Tax=Ornithinimicrobium cerasi TaxID=2248773 RepID=UPI000F010343|nr:pitrilysin family protein [Ornithinimicrobium cerasi]
MSARTTERPQVRPPGAWAFPEPDEHQLPNGLRLLVLDLPGQHVLSVRVALTLPVSSEVPGTEGSTLLMARALDEGTARHTSEELAELTERHGIAWGAGAGERGVHLGVEVTGRHLGTALEVLTECLAEATFPDTEVARLARHRLADIAHDDADPGARASLQFVRTYFDERDRPHTPLGGDRDSVASLTPEHLRERHAALSPVGGTVVLVGDLSTTPDAVRTVAATLGGWAGQARPPGPPGPARRAATAGRVVLVPRPGLAQTELYLGRPGPDRRTPHGWGTYQALGMLLGGSPHARIDRVLREERGWTYGVRAGFRPRAVGGLTVVGGSVRADATAPALEELLQILSVPGAGLGEAEVRAAADFVARTAPGRYGTADAVADELVALLSDGLGPRTVTETLEQLRTLTVEQVAAAWDEVLAGPPWTVVLVGDPGYAEGLADLGLGPVSVVG